MKNKLFFLFTTTLILLCFTPIFAMSQDGDVDVSNPASLVAYLSTFIVLGATWIVDKIAPSIPGWSTLIVVAGISAVLTWITNALANPDLSWIAQFGLGVASTFIHQVYKKLNPPLTT